MTASLPRIAVAGLGGYAQQHINQLETLQAGGLCEVVGFSDPFHARHTFLAAALKESGAKIYEDLDELLAKEQFDAIYLATPLHLHESQAITCLAAGRHVYVEKPPCATLGEWARMKAAQEQAGKVCAVGFQMQSHPATHFLRQQLAAGVLGDLEYVWGSVRWRRTTQYYERNDWAGKWWAGGKPVFDGPATNALAHVVQGALALTAPQGESAQLEKVRGRLWRARDIESYDTAYLEGVTTSGTHVRLAFTHATSADDLVVLRCRGTKGEATLDWAGNVTLTLKGEETRQWNYLANPSTVATLDFFRAIKEGGQPGTSLEDTKPFLELVNGALQSSGGSHKFDSSKTHFHNKGEKSGFWSVDGLETEFEKFGLDPEAIPAVLEAEDSAWVEVEKLSDELVV